MFGLLLSLAGNASIRLGVPGHACPFIGRQPCDPASLTVTTFHPTVVWLAFNFFVERPMARRRATFSPAWGGVSVMALLRFPSQKPPIHFMQTCNKWFGASVPAYRLTNSIKRMSDCACLGAIGFRLRATVPGMSVILSRNGQSGCNGFITTCRMVLT